MVRGLTRRNLEKEPEEEVRKGDNELAAIPFPPRRCGWIDLVSLNFACMINGVTRIVMTKADVLDAFGKLSVCTAYSVNGKEINEVPFQMDRTKPEPVYKDFKGWHTDTTKLTSYEGL